VNFGKYSEPATLAKRNVDPLQQELQGQSDTMSENTHAHSSDSPDSLQVCFVLRQMASLLIHLCVVLSAAPLDANYRPHMADRFLPSFRNRPFTHHLGRNITAALTVALINVPLSLSLAVASAATPQMGMISAIWAALFAAVLGGSQFNIVGPTGALSGILARYVLLWGPGCLPILAITSGMITLLVFLFNWDRYVTFLPSCRTRIHTRCDHHHRGWSTGRCILAATSSAIL
jgi:hypothetical protein